MAKRTILRIDAEKKAYALEILEDPEIIGPVDYAIKENMEKKTYENRILSGKCPFIFGIGPLAGTEIPGTARVSFFARSPIWHSLFSSTMGGAGLALVSSGVDLVHIDGKATTPLLVSVFTKGGKTQVGIKETTEKDLKLVYDGYCGLKGVYALQKYTLDTFRDNYLGGGGIFMNTRIFAVGPAAFSSDFALVGSTVISPKGDLETGRDDWSGRGGMGSVLAQAHNIAAIAFGGELKKERIGADALFKKALGKTVMQAAMEATEKYRYVDNMKTGGTFGVNFYNLQESSLVNNWDADMDEKSAKEIYRKKIKAKYLEGFNKNVNKTRSWATCGEACPGLCKKIDKKTGAKIDYEPYSASGPNSGVFDIRKSEKIVLLADTCGFDAIEFGNILSFCLDCMKHRLLTPADFGLSLDVSFSENQEILAERLAELMVSGEGLGGLLAKGARHASKSLDSAFVTRTEMQGIMFSDLAVYVPNGKHGSIAPIQYLVLGAFMPLPIQGKFLTHYGQEFLRPHDMGLKDAERFIEELGTDNLGICRFHRGWSETMQDVLLSHLGYTDNYRAHMLGVVQQIVKYNKLAGTTPVFWDSKKVIRLMAKDIEKKYEETPKNETLRFWHGKFKKDETKAAKEYWDAVLKEIERVFQISLV